MNRKTRHFIARVGILALACALMPAPRRARAASELDAHDNPFRYAAEYADPAWNGTYLRARWYAPPLASFLSRDPVAHHLSRYGYGGANPVMRVDPSGLTSYHSAVGRGTERFLERLDRGAGGDFARFFLSPALMPLQVIADPGAFWHSVKHDSGGIDVFLATGAAMQLVSLGGGYMASVRAAPSIARRAFWARSAAELAFGATQSTVGSYSGHLRHFHPEELIHNLEYNFGAESTIRLMAGLGYQPFDLTAERAQTLVARKLTSASTVLELRGHTGWQSPLRELVRGSAGYHEFLLRVTEDSILLTDGYGPAQYFGGEHSIEAVFAKAGLKGARLQSVRVFQDPDDVSELPSPQRRASYHSDLGKTPADTAGNTLRLRDGVTSGNPSNCSIHSQSIFDELGAQ